MNIYVPKYMYDLTTLEKIREENFRNYPDIVMDNMKNKPSNSYVVGWGDVPRSYKHGIIETGFFYEGIHLDTIGLYQHSSLTTPLANELIANFKSDNDIINKMLVNNSSASKYSQGQDREFCNKESFSWDGVVLALQNPTDRSVLSVTSEENYYDFIRGACKYYGKHLFVKLHPWNSGKVGERIRKLCASYGCQAAKVNHRVIMNCKFVLVFNSTFVVDCLMRGVKVAQYAPGYFWQSKAVQYTNYEYPDDVSTDIATGYKLCNFLVWKYCFNYNMSVDKWVALLRHFSVSKKVFPMTDEFCYATNYELQ